MAASTRALPPIQANDLKKMYESIVNLLYNTDEIRRGEIAILETNFLRYLKQQSFHSDNLSSLLMRSGITLREPRILRSIIEDIKHNSNQRLAACYTRAFDSEQNDEKELKTVKQSNQETLTLKLWKSIFIASLMDYKLQQQYKSAPSSSTPPICLKSSYAELYKKIEKWDKAHSSAKDGGDVENWKNAIRLAKEAIELAGILRNDALIKHTYRNLTLTYSRQSACFYKNCNYPGFINNHLTIVALIESTDCSSEADKYLIIKNIIKVANQACKEHILSNEWRDAKLMIQAAMRLCKQYTVDQECLDLTRKSLAFIKHHEAMLHFTKDRVLEGKQCLEAKIRLCKALKNRAIMRDVVDVHSEFGSAFYQNRQWAAAKANFAVSLFAAKELKDTPSIFRAREAFACTELSEGSEFLDRRNWIHAQPLLSHAAQRFKLLGNTAYQNYAQEKQIEAEEKIGVYYKQDGEYLRNYGEFIEAEEQFLNAERCFNTILKLTNIRLTNHRSRIATAQQNLTWVKISLGNLCDESNRDIRALEYYQEALVLAQDSNDSQTIAFLHKIIADMSNTTQAAKKSIRVSFIL